MATSSILGGAPAPQRHSGTGVDSLGPSDTSDSGSDVQTDLNQAALPDAGSEGAIPIQHGSDTDSAGTGERAAAGPSRVKPNADLLPDRDLDIPTDALDDEAGKAGGAGES